MGDVMLIGVLRMPPEMWSGDAIDVMQRHSRYIQAADRIEADAAKLAKVRELIENAAPHWYCNKCGWFGDTGAEHSGCDYFAADVRSVRVAELTAILEGDSK